MTRKPRSDAKLLNLPAHQQDALAGWLLDEGLSYKKAKARLHDDFNVETSEAALVEFWRHVCQPRRLRRSAAAASALPELSEAMDVNWEQSTMALIQQSVFEMLSQPAVDPEAVFFLGQILEKMKGRAIKERELEARIAGSNLRFEQKDREIAQKDEQLRLAQKKFQRETASLFLKWQADERAKAIAGSGATNAEKIEALGQAMFGEDWAD